ncbi:MULTISPECIES: hypothetical protein [Cyanophyceae]|uniref:Uncharacterized protein n=1 Tax=Leptolyngbya subtilissima DQ-A4 TaxID=2933933 RepID=A0ABV0JZN4_9CYAN|nr:hypothetical protein [Nodosilinea sp. FACHB-141]MBD2112578.1 hypothetical protein [Nodosilinea sp. FACHB-141]
MVQSLWQDALNLQLAQRLLRPLIRPGVIPDTLAVAIFERSRQFKQRLSLLHHFQQRWNKQFDLQVPDIPIVYAHWAAPATQSVVSDNLSDRNQEGSSESVRIEREHTISTQTVIQQPVDGATDSASPSLPLVIQAKFVDPAASTATSHLLPTPSNSTSLQSSIKDRETEGRESALPRLSVSAASIPKSSQLPIVTASPRSPLLEPELNRGMSSVEEQALVVKADNQPALPTSSQLPEQKPLLRSPAVNQLPLASATSQPIGSELTTAIAALTTESQPLEELPLTKAEKVQLVVKADNQPELPTSSQLPEQKPLMRSPAANQLPLSSATSPPTGSDLNTAIAALTTESQPLEELPLTKAEKVQLVVKADNQPELPTSSQLPEQKPLMRSPAANQLPLSSATSPPTGSDLNTAIAAPTTGSQPLGELPLVKVENAAALSPSQALRQQTQPMVFAHALTQVSSSKQELPMTTAFSHQSTDRSPIVNGQPANQTLSTPTVSPTQPSVDVSRLTQQVERKLIRKLAVERERRGQRTWH